MIRRLLALLLAVLLAGLSGCQSRGAGAESHGPSSESTPAGFPLTLTDAAGRSVTLEKAPERIISAYYIATSLLLALGQSEKLVGIEDKAASREIYALAAPGLLTLPNVGTAKSFDTEKALSLKPDLVVLPMKLREAADTLSDLGIPVLLISPESKEELFFAAELLGNACGSERASGLLSDYEASETELAARLSGVSPKKVYLAGNSSYLRTAGSGMYQHSLLTAAAADNAAAGLPGSSWNEIQTEQLLAYDPDAILIAADAVYTKEALMSDPLLAELHAVKSGAVYQIPGSPEALDSPVPGSFLGSWYIAAALYPERVTETEAAARAAAFYEKYYGIRAEARPAF